MPYTLKRTNGTTLAIIQDGSIDSSRDLVFVGKNYAGYGQTVNENFLQLLENFSSTRQPGNPLSGQLWFDSGNLKLNIFDGNRFKQVTVTDNNVTRPSDLRAGDQWFDPVNQKLYVKTDSGWAFIGPEKTAAALQSAIQSINVIDNRYDPAKTVLSASIGSGSNSVFGVFSKEAFVPADTDQIKTDQKYQNIVRGLSLPGYTAKSSSGIAGVGAEPDSDHIDTLFFGAASASWGMLAKDSSNVVRFFESADFVRYTGQNIAVSGTITTTDDTGITVGSGLTIGANGDIGVITNPNGTRLSFNSKIAGSLANILSLDYNGSAVVISVNSTRATDLGTNTVPLRNVYSTNVYSNNLVAPSGSGTISGTWQLAQGATISGGSIVSASATNSTNATNLESYTGSSFVHAQVDSTAFSIAQRDGDGAITALGLKSGVGGGTISGAWAVGAGSTLQATTLLGTGSTGYVSASQSATGNTVAQRNGTGGLVATNIITPLISAGALVNAPGQISGQWTLTSGSSLEATYADIAERYHADAEYQPGTVLVIGGLNEVTTTTVKGDYRAAGIVSTNPAFKLNSEAGPDSTHPYIALRGRVPCKVVGPVFKGDRIVASSRPGYGERSMDPADAIIGLALQDCVVDEGIVEVLVK